MTVSKILFFSIIYIFYLILNNLAIFILIVLNIIALLNQFSSNLFLINILSTYSSLLLYIYIFL